MIKLFEKTIVKLPILTTAFWLAPVLFVHAQGFRKVKWESPLAFTTAEGLIIAVLNAVITIAIPIVVLMIMYGGFQYVTARGNAEQIKTATRTLTYAIIGGILIIGAVAITGIMEAAITEF